MKQYLAAVMSAAALLAVATASGSFANPCLYGCYDFCYQAFPGAGNTFERYQCYADCETICG